MAPPQGKKQALVLARASIHILEKVITLLLNGFGERLPLLHIPLDYIKQQTRSRASRRDCGRSKPRIDNTRRVIIVNKTHTTIMSVSDLLRTEQCTDVKGRCTGNEGNRHNEVVGIRDRGQCPPIPMQWAATAVPLKPHPFFPQRDPTDPFAKTA